MLHDHHGAWSSMVFPFPCPSTDSCGEKGSPPAPCERSSRFTRASKVPQALKTWRTKGLRKLCQKKKSTTINDVY